MKEQEIINEATCIGDDSYELQNFMQLKKTASNKSQIEALKSDQSWQRNHFDGISARIDELIQRLE